MAAALETRAGVTETLGHYILGEKIGSGAMGEVFRARDRHLGHEVAIKILPSGLIADASARKHFRNEARALCRLNHPNIACFYDFDTQGTTDFLVMELVLGTTVSEQIAAGPIPEEQARELAVQLATGLAAAHREGVIHRDLKPKNLKLTPSGRLKILDFGLARLLPSGPPDSAETECPSRSWVIVGTLPYMSPEQLRGQLADARSDVWAAGVVLYEMLTGRLPFLAAPTYTIAEAIQRRSVTAPRSIVPAISVAMQNIVLKCLQKDPNRRYQSADEFLADLQSAPGLHSAAKRISQQLQSWIPPVDRWHRKRIVLLVIVLLALVLVFWPSNPGDSTVFLRREIAVLPFDAVPPEPGTLAFSRGLSDSLTAKLTRLTNKHNLQIVPQTEIRKQGVTNVDEARAQLGASLVIEGTFHVSGSRTRVTYNLISTADRSLLRADNITADSADPFALEDRIVESALESLDLELTEQERKELAERGTSEPQAYDLYVRARGYLQDYEKPEHISSAIELFRRAIDNDPKYALAYAGLGESYWLEFESTHNRQWLDKAEEACRRANLAGAGHGCLGTIYNGTGKYADAAAEFQRELAENPTNDSAYRGLAYAYEHNGDNSSAERTYRQAIEVRPQYWAGYNWLGTFLYRQGRYEEATEKFAKVTELSPDNVRGYYNLAGIQIALGHYDAAVPVLQQSMRIRATQDAYNNLGTAFFYLHRFRDAADAFSSARNVDPQSRIAWANFADAAYWIPDRRNEACAAYQKAISLAREELRVNPNDSSLLSYLALYHAMLHEKDAALENLSAAQRHSNNNADVFFNAALIYNQFNQTRQALAELRKALQAGIRPVQIKSHAAFDNLHSEPEFQALVAGRRS